MQVGRRGVRGNRQPRSLGSGLRSKSMPDLPKTANQVQTSSDIEDDSDFDDTSSVVSSQSIANSEEGEDATTRKKDSLVSHMKNLEEKRSSIRETALLAMRKLLSTSVMGEACLENSAELMDLLLKSLRRGGATESTLAAEVLSLFFISVGADHEGLVEDAMPGLRTVINNSLSEESQLAAVHAAAMATFISGASTEGTLECMKLLEDKAGSDDVSVEVMAGAIEAWTLLATTLSPPLLSANLRQIVQRLVNYLRHDDIDVRLASGDALAVVYELTADNEEAWHEAKYPTSREFYEDDDEVPEEDSEWEVTRDLYSSTLSLLKDLAMDSSKQESRGDRQRQRSLFRDVYAYFKDGNKAAPFHQVRVQREVAEISGWSQQRQFDSVKRLIGPGLHAHIQGNSALRAMLRLPDELPILRDDSPRDHMSPQERRLLMSPNSPAAKARSKMLTQSRRGKAAFNYGAD